MDRLDAYDLGGRELLFVADGAEGVGGHIGGRRLVEAFVAAGKDLVGDVMPCTRPTRQSPSAEEFRVIGMGKDDKDVLRGVPGVGESHVSNSRGQIPA